MWKRFLCSNTLYIAFIMPRTLLFAYSLTLVFLLCANELYAQNNGKIFGTVIDNDTKEPIIGAASYIKVLSNGAVSDLEGNYEIKNVPNGTYTITFSYLGYQRIEKEITIENGKELRLDIKMLSSTIQGEEITVLAQAAGQAAAIQQQLNSNTIVNVVSRERLQEQPDQNAAESVARLPGVSVQRDAGEASKVVIRGLSPKFNSITVNGVRIPGSDPTDRSVDLSLIPPEVLDGIEVFKALTPDKDADAIGGTVNLLLRKAPEGFRGDFALEGGYNDLKQTFQDYKGSLNISDRIFDGKLGILLTASAQQINRSAQIVNAEYIFTENDSLLLVEDLNLTDNTELRDRYGLGLSLDYAVGNNEFFLSSFMGRTDREELRVRKRYRVENTRTEYDLRDRNRFSAVYINSLRGEHKANKLKLDWQLSQSFALSKTPNENFGRFVEVGAYNTVPSGREPLADIPGFARNNLDNTYYLFGTNTQRRNSDRDVTASVNATYDFELGEKISGYLKVGAKIWDKKRLANEDELRTPFGAIDRIGQDNADEFDLVNGRIGINNFIDPNYDSSSFLDNQGFLITTGLSQGAINGFHDRFGDIYETNRVIDLGDYEAGEQITSAYVMTEINLGKALTIIPGIRYEQTENNYVGNFGFLFNDLGRSGTISDTTGGQTYDAFFPMVQMRLNITENISLRLAYTQTLARPDYFNLVPFELINDTERSIARGNPNLQPTSARNYDAFLSFFSPRYGYLSIGGFYKELDNIDYQTISRIQEQGEFRGYLLTQVVNSTEITTVLGFELDLQTDFRFLPKPFNGFVMSTNLAIIESKTFFPIQVNTGVRSPNPPFTPIIIDTVRSGRLPGQPNLVGAFTLGYEVGGFSARISLNHQQRILQSIGNIELTDVSSDDFSFWDFQITQKIARYEGLSIFANVNNFTNERESTTIGGGDQFRLARRELYGLRGTIGARYKF